MKSAIVSELGTIADFLVRPAWVYSNGCKSLTRPDSGKCLANAKGVHRELESEGR